MLSGYTWNFLSTLQTRPTANPIYNARCKIFSLFLDIISVFPSFLNMTCTSNLGLITYLYFNPQKFYIKQMLKISAFPLDSGKDCKSNQK